MSRLGLAPLSTEKACETFDAAVLLDRAVLVATRMDRVALSENGALPALLTELAARPARRAIRDVDDAATTRGLAARLHGLNPEARQRQLLDLVRRNAATVLGLTHPAEIDAGRAFQEQGFDSLTAVELRNRLKNATGLTLSPTLIFDQPTPGVLAEHLDAALAGAATPDQQNLIARVNDITRELQTLLNLPTWTGVDKSTLRSRVHNLLTTAAFLDDPDSEHLDSDLADVTESELFAILDDELGR